MPQRLQAYLELARDLSHLRKISGSKKKKDFRLRLFQCKMFYIDVKYFSCRIICKEMIFFVFHISMFGSNILKMSFFFFFFKKKSWKGNWTSATTGKLVRKIRQEYERFNSVEALICIPINRTNFMIFLLEMPPWV